VSHRHGRKLDFPSTDRVKELLQSNTFISYRVLYGKSDWRPVRGWGGKSGGTEYWGNGHFRLETVGRCYGTDRRHRPKVSKQTFWFGSVAFCDDLEVNVVQPEGVELKVVDHTNVIIVFPNNCTKPSRGPFSIDNVTNRRIVCHQLDTWKMKVETAAGGGEALKMRSRCHRKAVQSALLDVQMPDMDGWQLAYAIQADPALRETWIIPWPYCRNWVTGRTPWRTARPLACQRANVNDLPAATSFDHPSRGLASNQKGTGQVGIENCLPLCALQIQNRLPQLNASVVHQDVDCDAALIEPGKRVLHSLFLGDVKG
jgi:CheY-like chemotaxis protein